MRSEHTHYHKVAMTLHWVMAIAIIALIALGLIMEDVKPISLRIDAYILHKSLGLSILFLAFVRLGWRLTHSVPALPADMGRLEKTGAHAAHWALYALMIIMPLSGWVMASASKYPTIFFWFTEVPHLPLGEAKKAIGKQAYTIHEVTTQWIAIPMIVLHIAAALYHHYIRKDNVLTRMLPWVKKKE